MILDSLVNREMERLFVATERAGVVLLIEVTEEIEYEIVPITGMHRTGFKHCRVWYRSELEECVDGRSRMRMRVPVGSEWDEIMHFLVRLRETYERGGRLRDFRTPCLRPASTMLLGVFGLPWRGYS